LNASDYFLDRHLREGRGGRIAVAGVGPPVSYEELAERAARVAAAWQELGVAPGERVLLVLPDSAEWLACFFGTVKMGAIAVPVNPFTRRADFAYYAADCRPRLAVAHAASFAEALPALREASPVPRILTLAGHAEGCERLEDWLKRCAPVREARFTKPDDIAFFLYTSGSGGEPKAAMHRHAHMLATSDAFARQVIGFHEDDVAFSASKLFFAYGLGNAGYFPLSVGAASVFLPERPTPERLFEVIARHRPTLFFSVPTLYGALLRATEGGGPRLDSVRACVSAGEALPAEIFERFRARFGQEILDGIGTTEMLHMFISNRPGEARPGTCGRLVPGYEARIADDEASKTHLPDGQVGNLWVRGPSTMAGYWQKPELTGRVLRDGWYSTGDKFFRDADGFYHYCGRADDMLKVAGMWVSPLEVENALLAHAAVAEAAVVGQRAPDGLTRIAAFIVLKDAWAAQASSPVQSREALEGERAPLSRAPHGGARDSSASILRDELRAFIRQRLPGYKVPQRIEFVTELPKTATGKIQRFKLRS
jgi:benzoate-CoA ligase family protein